VGGTTDLLGCLVADQIKIGLDATVLIENKPAQTPGLLPSRSHAPNPTATRS
jgi:hypothetical protein